MPSLRIYLLRKTTFFEFEAHAHAEESVWKADIKKYSSHEQKEIWLLLSQEILESSKLISCVITGYLRSRNKMSNVEAFNFSHKEFLPPNETVNRHFYLQLLKRLRKRVLASTWNWLAMIFVYSQSFRIFNHSTERVFNLKSIITFIWILVTFYFLRQL